MSTVFVRYIGLKDREIDKPTRMVWEGKGAVRAVDSSQWPRMAKHTDMWELAEAPAESGLAAVVPKPVPQEVDDADLVAQTITIKPPEVVAAAPAAPEVPTGSAPAPVDLDSMNTEALRAYAASKGYAVDLSQKAKDLRPAIRAIEAGA